MMFLRWYGLMGAFTIAPKLTQSIDNLQWGAAAVTAIMLAVFCALAVGHFPRKD